MVSLAGAAPEARSKQGMTTYQILLVALCCLCNAADGFDVVSLSLAAPVLAKDWRIDPAMLGTLFSASAMGLVGGSFLIAPLADRFGRRPIMLAALGMLALCMLGTGLANNVSQLFVLRLTTGLALGTLVVSLNVTVAEFSSDRHRNLSMAVLHTGFTFGQMIGSTIAAVVLASAHWRYIFFAAGILNVLTFSLALFLLAESPRFLANRSRPADKVRLAALLRKANLDEKYLATDGHAARPSVTRNLAALLAPSMRALSILFWLTAVTYAIVGYFQLNWKPTILANAGLSPSMAAAAGIVTGACGTIGHLAMGLLARPIGEARLTVIFFALAAVSLTIFGLMPPMAVPLIAMAGLASAFVVGAYTGLFLVAVQFYQPGVQNIAVSFMVGFSRIGAIIGPMIGGFLISAGFDRMQTYFIFSAIALMPAVALWFAGRLALRATATAGA
jgi:predicted MFS family arabinose efflux permease